jgi:NurA-like 5'-3' nuclease
LSEELFTIAARKREDILRKVAELAFHEYLERARDLWLPYMPKSNPPKAVAGVDGGNQKVDFKGFSLYAVTGSSVTYVYDNVNDKFVVKNSFTLADLDILTPPQITERIDLYREILEAKAALIASQNEAKLILIDGSLRSTLITPYPLRGEKRLAVALKQLMEVWGESYLWELKSRLIKGIDNPSIFKTEPIASKEILKDEPSADEDTIPAILFLEYVEKLLVYWHLIINMTKKSYLPIFISKNSRSQLYFKGLGKEIGKQPPPDIFIFESLSEDAGYTIPYPLSDEEAKPLKHMPAVLDLNRLYNKLRVATTYIRLQHGAPVLRIEIPYIKDSNEITVSNDLIESLMNSLVTISSDGYPYPLIEAHMVSHIRRDVMTSLAHALGLEAYLTGREVVEEWLL